MQSKVDDSVKQLYTRIEEERLYAAQRLDGSVRALHCIQKLMGRPDGADIFQEFDTDGDGQISREELRAGFAKIGEELSEADIDAIMTLADTDGDGTIDTNEFVQMGKMTKEVEAMSKTMIAGLDALSVRLDDEVVGMTSSMTSIVSSVGADLERRIDTECLSTLGQLNKTFDAFKSDVDHNIATLTADLSSQMLSIDERVTKEVLDVSALVVCRASECNFVLRQTTNLLRAELGRTIQNTDDKLSAAVSTLQSKMHSDMNQLSSKLDNDVDGLRKQMQDSVLPIASKIDTQVISLETKLSALHNHVAVSYTHLTLPTKA